MEMNPKAKALFEATLKGKNIMTPEILAYGVRGIMAYELSEGTDFHHKPIYGVTVIEMTGKRRNDLSQVFSSLEDADVFIENLSSIKSLKENS